MRGIYDYIVAMVPECVTIDHILMQLVNNEFTVQLVCGLHEKKSMQGLIECLVGAPKLLPSGVGKPLYTNPQLSRPGFFLVQKLKVI